MNLSRLFSPLLRLGLLGLCWAASATAATVEDCLASPADWGLPPLRFGESPAAPAPLPPYEWQLPGGSTLKASLLHVLDYGTPQARAVLATPEGKRHQLPLREMLPGDRLLAENWLTSRGFVVLPLWPSGVICARVMELRDTGVKHPFSLVEIRLMSPDGRQHVYCCNGEPITPAQARTKHHLNGLDCLYFTDAGLRRIRQAQKAPQQVGAAAPILMASSPTEARAYAELHGLTVVTIYLNQRGSEIDLAWKEYLRRYPEAGAYWNNKYVFVGVYCDEKGNYPAELLQQIRVSFPYGTGDMTPPLALHTGSSYKGVPRFLSRPDVLESCHTIADLLNTPPSKILFRH